MERPLEVAPRKSDARSMDVRVRSAHAFYRAIASKEQTQVEIECLRRGVELREVSADGVGTEKFNSLIRCRIDQNSKGDWSATIGPIVRRGSDPPSAWRNAVFAVRFRRLAALWLRDVTGLSLRSAKFAHPRYAEILALGNGAVPEILRWLRGGRHGHWDDALERLTGGEPDSFGEFTDLTDLANKWVMWGREQRIIEDGDDR